MKTFERDRILRNKQGRPIGRVILVDKYKESDRIPIAVVEIPRSLTGDPTKIDMYIDGRKYKLQDNINRIKIGGDSFRHLINGVYLELVNE